VYALQASFSSHVLAHPVYFRVSNGSDHLTLGILFGLENKL